MGFRFRRFFVTLLAVQIGLETALAFLEWPSTSYKAVWLLTFALVFAAGYGADRAKMSLMRAAFCALPFLLIGFCHGLVNFALGIDEPPGHWSARERQLAFYGYLVANGMMLIVFAVTAFVGAVTSRVVTRLQRRRGHAV